jgi:hypothetical protein
MLLSPHDSPGPGRCGRMASSPPSVDPAAVNPAAHRRYAVRRVIARAQWGFAVVLVLVWVLGITEHAALVFLAIAAAGSTLAVWQGVEQLRNGGVSETADGVANRTTFGYRRWRWDEIDHFRHVGSRVYLVTRDHQSCQLAGVNEGWRNIWEDGETRAITELLNQRLEQRGSPGAA